MQYIVIDNISQSILDSLFRQSLAAVIQFFKFPRKLCGICSIRRFQKRTCSERGVETPARIHTWTQYKADSVCIKSRNIDAASFRQCPKTRILRLSELFQPFLHKNSVLPCQIDDVTDSGESSELKKLFLSVTAHCKDQFPCNGSTTEFFKRVRTVLLFRIHDSIGSIRNSQHFMMIRHDNSQPQFFGYTDLLSRRDSVITCHDGIDAVLGGLPYQICIDPVPVRDAVRNLDVHICPQLGESFFKNKGRHDAVDIIIADDPYAFLFRNLLL